MRILPALARAIFAKGVMRMVKDMTYGSPTRLIVSFSIPIVIGNLFQQLYNMVDTIIVGQCIGVDALAAVGATGSLNFLVIGFVLGMCSGFCIPVAQAFGAGDYKQMRRCVMNAYYLSLLITVVLTVLTVLLTRPILELMQTPANIIDDAYRYIVVIFGGMFSILFYNLFSGIWRALGDSRTPLYFLILASLLNVVLDLVFILSFSWGVAGAAYATVISQAVSAVLCFLYMRRKLPILAASRDERRPDLRIMGRLLYMGLPMALQFSITAIGSIILQSAVNALGSSVVAAVTAGGKVQMIVTQPMETLGLTMATFCGQNLGAGRIDRVKAGVRNSLIISMICCLVGWAVSFFAGRFISLLFISASETMILDYTQQFLRMNALFYPMLGALLILRNSIQGLGYSVPAMAAGAFELVARGLVGFLLAGLFGFGAICFANPIAWIFACVFLIPAYLVVIRRLTRAYPPQAGTEPAI